MSKHTANSVAELLKMPMELVLAFYNTLGDLFKKEREAQEKQQQQAASGGGGGSSGMGDMAGMGSQMGSAMNSFKNQWNGMMKGFKMPDFGNINKTPTM